MQLPPIRRQIINLFLKKSDIDFAIKACNVINDDASTENEAEDGLSDDLIKNDEKGEISAFHLSVHVNRVLSFSYQTIIHALPINDIFIAIGDFTSSIEPRFSWDFQNFGHIHVSQAWLVFRASYAKVLYYTVLTSININ